ncbi:MAG TPA: amidase family protein, partial [Cyclobacteriaceae bacterium]|nr:amidase family protein [Cyclobacteriaceae bacterium]
MDRRKFLRNTSVTGLALTGLVSGSCVTPAGKKDPEDSAGSLGDEFPLNEITIDELQQKMVGAEYTSRSITELYLRRIEAMDKNGPKLNSVIELNPDALTIADALDLERKKGKVRGPLHGIPVLIKDNIDTGDK